MPICFSQIRRAFGNDAAPQPHDYLTEGMNSVLPQRHGRVLIIFNADSVSKRMWVKLCAARGLLIPGSIVHSDKLFARVYVMPDEDPAPVSRTLFKPYSGLPKPHGYKKSSTTHRVTATVDFDEDFEFDLAEVWPQAGGFRLYVCVMTTAPGAPVIGCCSFPLGRVCTPAATVMTRPSWFWLMNREVGLHGAESVEQLASGSVASMSAGQGLSGPQPGVTVAGRDPFLSNAIINDEYTWTPTIFAGRPVYRGRESGLSLYFLPGRGAWTIGSVAGSLLPFAYIENSTANTPANLSGTWQINTVERDPWALELESTQGYSTGLFEPDTRVRTTLTRFVTGVISGREYDATLGATYPEEEMKAPSGYVTVTLFKGKGQHGMKLAYRNKAAFVKEIEPGSISEKSGQVIKGMRIISVNNVSTAGLDEKDILELLKKDSVLRIEFEMPDLEEEADRRAAVVYAEARKRAEQKVHAEATKSMRQQEEIAVQEIAKAEVKAREAKVALDRKKQEWAIEEGARRQSVAIQDEIAVAVDEVSKATVAASKWKEVEALPVEEIPGFPLTALDQRCSIAWQKKGLGHVRFIGRKAGTKKFLPIIGVELDNPFGDINGVVNGDTYFFTRKKYGILVDPKKVLLLEGKGDDANMILKQQAEEMETAMKKLNRISSSIRR